MERAFPERITEKCHRTGPGLRILLPNPAAEKRSHTPKRRGVRRDRATIQLFGSTLVGINEIHSGIGHDVFKRLALFAKRCDLVEVVDLAKPFRVMLRVDDADYRQAFRVAIREWMQHAVIEDAEDNRGKADAQRQCNNSHHAKTRILAQSSNTEP